jgi:hypothetical protein
MQLQNLQDSSKTDGGEAAERQAERAPPLITE